MYGQPSRPVTATCASRQNNAADTQSEWQEDEADSDRIERASSCQNKEGTASHHALILQIYLVAKQNEGEVVGVGRTGLNQEFVPPVVERIERLFAGDIKYQYTCIGAPVECDAQALEPLLPRCVPYLHDTAH